MKSLEREFMHGHKHHRGRSPFRTPSSTRNKRPRPSPSGSSGGSGFSSHSRGRKAAKVRFSLSRSRSRSTSKTITESDDFGGGKYSFFKFNYHEKNALPKGKMGAPALAQNNVAVHNYSVNGQQQWGNFSPINGGVFQFLQAIAQNQMENFLNLPTTAIGSTPAIYAEPFLQYCSSEYKIVNMSAMVIEVEIYDYVYRRDQNAANDALTLLSNITTEKTGAVPSTQVPTYNSIGFQPTDSTAFVNNIKILRRRKIFLQAGENHIHKININCNWLYKAALKTTGIEFFAGKTVGMLVRYVGTLCTDNGGNIDASRASLGVYVINRYKLRPWMSITKPSINYQNTITPLVGAVKVVDETVGQELLEGTGLVSNLVI